MGCVVSFLPTSTSRAIQHSPRMTDQIASETPVPSHDRLAALGPDMTSYLQGEAQRCSVGIEDVSREEMAAKAELTRITPGNADLLRIAERCPAPQAWYDE